MDFRSSRGIAAARLPLAYLIGACTGAADGAPAAVERTDSAGIEIVKNPGTLRGAAYAELDTQPAVVIGGREGDPAHELFRVSGALRLGDGGIAVVNAGSHEIRFYDASGEHVRSVGGEGDGPGEFRNPILVRSVGVDSLLVYDFANRFAFVGPDGRIGEMRVLRGHIGSPVIRSGNRLLLSAGTARAAMDTPEGLMANRGILRLLDLSTLDTTLIADLEGIELFLSNDGRTIAFTQVPFDAAPSATMWPGGIFIAPGEPPEVRQYDEDGRVVRIIRLPIEPRPLTRADFDAFVEERVAALRDPAAPPELRRRYGAMPVRPALPAVQDLRVDADGNVWAQEYRADQTEPQRWLVFDSAGTVLGRVETPAALRIEQIGSDFVLGLARDELGLETVQLYGLRRAGGEM